jgi:hypothetical protein
MESEDSFDEIEFDDDDDAGDVNPRTGRPTRRSLKNKETNYAESEFDEEVEDNDSIDAKSEPDDDSEDEGVTRKRKLIVTLSLPPDELQKVTERPTTSRQHRIRATRSASAPRRASSEKPNRRTRASQEPDEPLLELTNSGHARPVAGKGPARPAGKTPAKKAAKQPSVIMEESQETSVVNVDDEEADDAELLDKPDVLVESIERPQIENSQPEKSADEQFQGDDDDDDDDDDIPIRRTRGQQAKQVS